MVISVMYILVGFAIGAIINIMFQAIGINNELNRTANLNVRIADTLGNIAVTHRRIADVLEKLAEEAAKK